MKCSASIRGATHAGLLDGLVMSGGLLEFRRAKFARLAGLLSRQELDETCGLISIEHAVDYWRLS